MARVRHLPARGEVFDDLRGQGRALRLSWHNDEDMLVLSLWREDICTGSFRMAKHEVPGLIYSLVRGLAQGRRDRHAS